MGGRGGIDALLGLMDEAFRGAGIEESNESPALLPNADDGILLVGSPTSDTDVSVPPCNGPNEPATIQMQPWAPTGE